MVLPLEIVGHIEIPDSVRSHRFYHECMGVVSLFQKKITEKLSREPVLGTANTGEVELYGWARSVAKHTDNTGIIYFVALNDADSIVISVNEGQETVVDLKKGAVVRMDDHIPHFTFDDSERICAFIGSYKEPQDALALRKLRKGIKTLAAGKYYGAPRVQPGFRAIMSDECFVMTKDCESVELMLLDDAKKKRRLIETCALCDGLAVKIDQHYPWHVDMNRCRNHLIEDSNK
jgi:hypothetical protein